MPESAQEVLKLIQEKDIQVIDLKFIDLPGIWQHLTLHHSQIDADSFTDGVAFDGSSIRGLEKHQRVGHGHGTGSENRLDGSVYERTDLEHGVQHQGTPYRANVRSLSSDHRRQSPRLPESDGNWR